MNDNPDPLAMARAVDIPPDALSRWIATERTLDGVTSAVSTELRDLFRDPCQHRSQRAAGAARYAAGIAIALAEDLERFAGG